MDEVIEIKSLFTESTLLWLAVGLAGAFLALLTFDFIRRQRRRHRHHHHHHHHSSLPQPTLGQKLLQPLRNLKEAQRAVGHLLRKRARHRRREEERRLRRLNEPDAVGRGEFRSVASFRAQSEVQEAKPLGQSESAETVQSTASPQ